ncbi:hypothetical protein CWC05_19740, partial [Pseudoalteromonas ruthenica]
MLKKSLITCAVALALGYGNVAVANDSKDTSHSITSDFMANAQQNKVEISQKSINPANGNNATVEQTGNINGAQLAVEGDDNQLSSVQAGDNNLQTTSVNGNSNHIANNQNGSDAKTQIEIAGNANMLAITQEGA